ncbi:MAG: phytanoyl-CoA dioxygenase family protein [Synechococcus sp.]
MHQSLGHGQDLKQNGFTLIRNPFPNGYIATIADWLDRQFPVITAPCYESPHEAFGLSDPPTHGVLYDPWHRYPICRDLAANPAIYAALKEVIGEDIFLYESSFLFKTPLTADKVPWHQDFMNRPDEPVKYVAFMGIDPLKRGSGALNVIPGSHKRGFLPSRFKQGEAHHTGIPEQLYATLDVEKSIPIEQEPGDILIFHQLLVHSLDECDSTSDSLCRSFRFSYQSFDGMYTPRHTPVTVWGGDPSSIASSQYMVHPKAKEHASLMRRLIRKIKF